MSTYKNLISLGAAAVLALGLAACSSGSDTPLTPDPDPDPDPTPTPTACETNATSQACVDQRDGELKAAQKALEALEDDDNSTQAQLKAARKAVADAQTAYDSAVTALATYNAMQPPMYDTADVLKAMDEAIQSPTALPTADGITAADGGTSAVMGGEVTVNDTATPPANTFLQATWPVGKITGWSGSVWEKSADGDSIVVYTDKEADKGAKWSAFYASTAPTGTADGFTWSARTGGISGVTGEGVMSFNTNVSASSKLFSAAGFPDGKGRAITYPDNDDDPGNNFKVEFAGTFHGIAGTFNCDNGSACSATNNAAGELTTLSNGWSFTPTSTDSMVADVRTDADYMDFGYWVRTDDSGDTVDYDVNSFARGQDTSDVSAALKTATYKGGAAGLYTKRAFATDGKGAVEAAGRFTADAELTASFDGSDVAANKQNSITGKINNFMDGAGNVIDAAWSLELMSAQITPSSGAIAAGGAHTAKTTGGGDWTGQFYGADATTTAYPTGVAGQFDGIFNNGRVLGSFGATHSK